MSELEYREEAYGEEILAVEPGGIEAIPDGARHGKAWNLFAVWTSPNLEFATIYVGALGLLFGLTFRQAVVGIIIGNALGAFTQYLLTQDGPKYGVPQMVVSRSAFGRVGNVFPALTNALTAGWGWFAVNSASGAFALNAATHWNTFLCLFIVAVLQIGIHLRPVVRMNPLTPELVGLRATARVQVVERIHALVPGGGSVDPSCASSAPTFPRAALRR